MRMFVDPSAVYLYPKTVDFRRQFNGLALIVEQEIDVSLMSGALFVFTNRGSRDFPSKNDKVLWKPRHLWPLEGYYFFHIPILALIG